jgi:hypothetical protein
LAATWVEGQQAFRFHIIQHLRLLLLVMLQGTQGYRHLLLLVLPQA